MSRTRLVFVALLAAAALLAFGVATAVADSGCGSAGDQQYIDPLGCGPGTSSGSGSGSGSSSSGSSSDSSGNSSSAPDQTVTVASASSTGTTGSSTGTTSSASGSTAATLPYTGVDLWSLAGLGLILLAGGFTIRRFARAG